MVSSGAVLQPEKKSFARAAVIGLDPADIVVLRDCFALCGVKLAIAPVAQPARLEHEKFECCVIKIEPGCEVFLGELRRSAVNRNAVLIGLHSLDCGPGAYWKYGFNALLQSPLKVNEALEPLRMPCLVTVRHLRRHVRVPLATEVSAIADGQPLKCVSREISAGGLAMRVPSSVNVVKSWVIEFLLPGGQQVRIPCITCWSKPEASMVGLLFDPASEQRNAVKKWIEEFLAA